MKKHSPKNFFLESLPIISEFAISIILFSFIGYFIGNLINSIFASIGLLIGAFLGFFLNLHKIIKKFS